MSAAAPATTRTEAHQVRRRLRAIVIGSIGNLVGWYDSYACAAFSLDFARAFFPEGDEVAQQLSAALVFASASWCGRSAAGRSAAWPTAPAGGGR